MDNYTIDYVQAQNVAKAKQAMETSAMLGSFSVVVYLAVMVLSIVTSWKIFVKAGKAGWKSLIPIYNTVVMLEIVKLPVWYIILMFIPVVNVVVMIVMVVKTAKVFGRSIGFALGLLFLPLIFFPILAFGKSEYIG